MFGAKPSESLFRSSTLETAFRSGRKRRVATGITLGQKKKDADPRALNDNNPALDGMDAGNLLRKGPSAEMCRGLLLCKFGRILPGIFLKNFSGHSLLANDENPFFSFLPILALRGL